VLRRETGCFLLPPKENFCMFYNITIVLRSLLNYFSGVIMTVFKKTESAFRDTSSALADITHRNLIGTRWIATGTISKNKDTIEFVDKTYCVYTSINRLEPYIYRIRGNRIILGEHVSYVIKNNTLFLNGYPLFTRE
jgi:hypothetical protein